MTETEYATKSANDAIKGMDFIRDSNGKYKLLANNHDDGTISITLNEVTANQAGEAEFITPIFSLLLGDIYAQCAPERIIDRLNRDISEKCELINSIKADAPEIPPELDTPF